MTGPRTTHALASSGEKHMTPLLLLQLHITHLPDLGIRDMKLSRPLEEPSAIDLGNYQASRARSPFGTERRLRGGRNNEATLADAWHP